MLHEDPMKRVLSASLSVRLSILLLATILGTINTIFQISQLWLETYNCFGKIPNVLEKFVLAHICVKVDQK